jgi:hypothetical protein
MAGELVEDLVADQADRIVDHLEQDPPGLVGRGDQSRIEHFD